MDQSPQLERIANGVRGLSVAVWCLVAINCLQVVAWIVPFVAPSFYARQMASLSSSPELPKQTFESWEGLAFDEKVKRASVILITENKQEGGKIRAIIKEQIKRAPNTTFHYSVGDEYLPGTILEPKPDTRYGDGSLVLLQGSPATSHGSYAIYNGSIPGLGEMPVSKIREIVAASK
jgi:hypothetical protein